MFAYYLSVHALSCMRRILSHGAGFHPVGLLVTEEDKCCVVIPERISVEFGT